MSWSFCGDFPVLAQFVVMVLINSISEMLRLKNVNLV